jgi:hypothetical protein
LLLDPLEERRFLATIIWDDGGGDNDWNNAANWLDQTNGLNDVKPGAADDAVIGAAFAARTIVTDGNETINSVTSAVSLTIAGGIFTVGNDVSDASRLDGNFTLTAGSLEGTGTFTTSQQFDWDGGTMTGDSKTVLDDGSGENAGNAVVMNITDGDASEKRLTGGRTLENFGTVDWSGTERIRFGVGASIENKQFALFDLQSDARLANDLGNPVGIFNNAGTLQKSGGSGTSEFEAELNNNNLVDVQMGELQLENGGTSSGMFTVADNATLDFSASTFTLDASSQVTADGAVNFTGSSTTNVNGSYAVSSPTIIDGRTVNFNTDATSVTTEMHRATLGGTGTFTTSQQFDWDGGTMTGDSKTVLDDGSGENAGNASVINITDGDASEKRLTGGRTLENFGTVNWSGTERIRFGMGASIENKQFALFDLQSDARLANDLGNPVGIFNNAGTLRKSGGSGTSNVETTMTNTGTVHVQIGTVNLTVDFTNFDSNSATLTGGTYIVTDTLQFDDANVDTNAATIVLDGPSSRIVDANDVDAIDDFATNTAAGTFTLQNGRDYLTTSPFSNAGAVNIESNSRFTTEDVYVQTEGITLLDNGTLVSNQNSVDIQAGILQGDSSTVTGNVTNSGSVIPGLSPGVLGIEGDYEQTTDGSLELELGGLTPIDEFDQLVVFGTSDLGGTIMGMVQN